MATNVQKTLWQVVITAHDGSTYTADDATKAGLGSAAYQQIGHDFLLDNGTNKTFIPYHSVVKVVATPTLSTVAYADEICVEA